MEGNKYVIVFDDGGAEIAETDTDLLARYIDEPNFKAYLLGKEVKIELSIETIPSTRSPTRQTVFNMPLVE